jgi:hypothetical protein
MGPKHTLTFHKWEIIDDDAVDHVHWPGVQVVNTSIRTADSWTRFCFVIRKCSSLRDLAVEESCTPTGTLPADGGEKQEFRFLRPSGFRLLLRSLFAAAAPVEAFSFLFLADTWAVLEEDDVRRFGALLRGWGRLRRLGLMNTQFQVSRGDADRKTFLTTLAALIPARLEEFRVHDTAFHGVDRARVEKFARALLAPLHGSPTLRSFAAAWTHVAVRGAFRAGGHCARITLQEEAKLLAPLLASLQNLDRFALRIHPGENADSAPFERQELSCKACVWAGFLDALLSANRRKTAPTTIALALPSNLAGVWEATVVRLRDRLSGNARLT